MKPAYAMYLLQVEWTWDHSNTEFATITVEGREGCRYEPEFERLLDPDFPQVRKSGMIEELNAVAQAVARGTPGSCRVVRLYRIEDAVGILNGGQPNGAFAAGSLAVMQMTLRPVCEFDSEGAPIAPKGQSVELPAT